MSETLQVFLVVFSPSVMAFRSLIKTLCAPGDDVVVAGVD